MMKLNEANLLFRPRTDWEAIDLGFRMVARHRILLGFLWLCTSLPFVALIILLFWDEPAWAFTFIWWLKPVFERSTLYVLSISVFQSPPPFKTCLKESFKLMFSWRLIGDLTWRRLSPYRSVNLPINQLEKLTGRAYSVRAKRLDIQVSGGSTALTVLGANIEMILFIGVASFIWFAINVDATDALVQNYTSFFQALGAMGKALEEYAAYNESWAAQLSNLLYMLVLCVWGPVYSGCGFSLYLNARSKLEAWDVELTFRRLAQRLGQSLMVLCLGCFLLFSYTEQVQAEPLPDEKQVIQQRDELLSKPPYPTLKTKNEWCFITCDKDAKKNQPIPESTISRPTEAGMFANGFRVVMWIALAVILMLILFYLFRDPVWLANLTNRHKSAPSVLFGMDVTPESLPDDVATEAWKLFDHDPRAALGLLYRASLTQLLHQYDLPLRNGHTEGDILALTAKQASVVYSYMDTLTRYWSMLAYGHTLPPDEAKNILCKGYRQNFPENHNNINEQQGEKYA